MSEMKLIMESWRKYSSRTGECGPLYLFEGRRVRKTSFSKALDSIGDSEKELDLFFEQWEKSLDYELKKLNEVDWKTLKEDPVLYLSTQIFRLWNKAKKNILKYATSIIRGSHKLNALAAKFKTKSPSAYKLGAFISKTIVAFVALYVAQNVMGSADAMAGDMTQFGNVIADADQLSAVGDLMAQSDDENLKNIGGLFQHMAENPEDTDMFGKFGPLKDQIIAVAEQDIDELKRMSGQSAYGEQYTQLAEKAAEILRDAQEIQAPEAPEANPFAAGDPEANLGFTQSRSTGEIPLDTILDHIDLKVSRGREPNANETKLLNFLVNDTEKPEAARKAAEILSKL